MEDKNYIGEAYESCVKDAILYINSGGAGRAGFVSDTVFITKNNELYTYKKSLQRTRERKMENTTSLSKNIELGKEEMKVIIDFVKENVLPKNGTRIRMFDAFYSISGIIDGKSFSVVNDMEMTNKLKKLIDDMVVERIKKNYI